MAPSSQPQRRRRRRRRKRNQSNRAEKGKDEDDDDDDNDNCHRLAEKLAYQTHPATLHRVYYFLAWYLSVWVCVGGGVALAAHVVACKWENFAHQRAQIE